MRPGNVNGNCSIGAYEFVSPVTATITDCANDSQLQAAAAAGGRIVFACSGNIGLSQAVTLSSNTTVDGTGQSVTLSAPGGNRVFFMNGGVGTLNHLSLVNGYINQDNGGAVLANGSAILLNSTISNSVAAYYGGAVYGGALFLANDTFSGNGASGGGGGAQSTLAHSFLSQTAPSPATRFSRPARTAAARSITRDKTRSSAIQSFKAIPEVISQILLTRLAVVISRTTGTTSPTTAPVASLKGLRSKILRQS